MREFLRSMAERFELHVYTMGSREYASHVVQILDPEGTLFCGHVFTRDDFPGTPQPE